jgi:hypothetical protein
MLAVFIGIVVVIIAVVEWLDKTFTVIHAVAILTLIAGISIILGALGDRYHTRLLARRVYTEKYRGRSYLT